MKFKKITILAIFLVSLLAMGIVCAEDNNTSDIVGVDSSTTDIIEYESHLDSNASNSILTVTNCDENLRTSENNNELLSDSPKTFSQLDDLIQQSSGSVINLEFDYAYNPSTESFSDGIVIGRQITINGNGHSIDGNRQSRIFDVTASNVVLNNITFKNSYHNDRGGAIFWDGYTGSVVNCSFENNSANNYGGAIAWGKSDGSVVNCSFVDNSVNTYGGAIFWASSSGSVVDSSFVSNSAAQGGAIVWNNKGSSVVNCSFVDNSATNGGALLWNGDGGSVRDSSFVSNSASYGGAVLWAKSDGSIVNCSFVDNSAYYGGSIHWNTAPDGSVVDCRFENNSATNGGAIYWPSAGGSVRNSSFVNNSATYGGAVLWDGSDGSVRDSSFVDNYAIDGGAIHWLISGGSVVNCSFVDNSATNGGAVFWLGSDGSVRDSSFVNNSATVGGAIAWLGSDGSVRDSSFVDNLATDNGGAVCLGCNGSSVVDCSFVNCSASYGGAIWEFGNGSSVVDCSFVDNSASYGGAIWRFGNSSSVVNCSFEDNSATEEGGAISRIGDNGSVVDCIFDGNSASVGGAIALGGSEISVDNCSFVDNSASYGGAVYLNGNSTSVVNCSFVDNLATNRGGAIRWLGDNGSVVDCSFVDNSATNVGGGILWLGDNGSVVDSSFVNNSVTDQGGAIFWFGSNSSFVDCIFEGNSADYGAAIVSNGSDNSVVDSSFVDNSATIYGAAIYWNGTNGIVSGCAFVNNEASEGIIYMSLGTVENCNIINNKAGRRGTVLFANGEGNVINCNFTDNSAMKGGAVYFIVLGTATNCNFTNNTATDGGAIFFGSYCSNGTVTNCNFADNKATGDNGCGGAVSFESHEGTVTNCNFTNNIAGEGGAICFGHDCSMGTVTNCIFTNNSLTGYYGGAISFNGDGSVTYCNFTDNTASSGGAIYFMVYGSVTDCNFMDNTASGVGGAIYFLEDGSVTDCNFMDNTANIGGAISFMVYGNVTNCNFTGNNAIIGSAIYFFDDSSTNTVSNSIFLNNRANADELEVTQNENNIIITFTGNDNLLNAIYSEEGDVSFTNVTYWGANGIANTGSSPNILSKSNNEAGQNISVIIVVNDILVLNETKVTNENGAIVLDAVAGNSKVTAHHDADSYYTQTEATETFNIIGTETSLELSVSEFTVTAIISPDDIVGNITFTVENESGIVKTLETALNNGAADLDLSELAEGDYNITATYGGSINYYPAKANMSYQKGKIDVTIDVSADPVTYGDAVVVNIVASVDGEYNVAVGDKSEVATVENGIASVEFSGLGAGTYDVVASYHGDDTHKAASANTIVRINKAAPDIGISAKSIINYGEDLVVKVTSDDDLAYRVNVTVGDQSKLLRLKDGKGTIKFSDLAAGSYTVTALYKGDANYSSISADTAVVVKPIANLSISVSASGTGVVVVNVAGDVDLAYRVNVTVGSHSTLLRLKDGKGTLKYSDFEDGTYTVVAIYKGDAYYAPGSANTSFEVKKIIPNLTVSASATNNGIIVVNVTSDVDFANRVNVTVGNQSKLLRLKDGKGTLKFDGFDAGTYSVVALYKGDADCIPVSANTSVEVNEIIPNLTVSASADDNGIVIVNVNCDVDLAYRVNVTVGNQSKLLRLKNGAGTLKFNGLEAGTYDVVALYKGDSNFKPSSNSTTVVVD